MTPQDITYDATEFIASARTEVVLHNLSEPQLGAPHSFGVVVRAGELLKRYIQLVSDLPSRHP